MSCGWCSNYIKQIESLKSDIEHMKELNSVTIAKNLDIQNLRETVLKEQNDLLKGNVSLLYEKIKFLEEKISFLEQKTNNS